MIRYNWGAIKKYTKQDMKKILAYFHNVYVDNTDIQKYLLNNEYARKITKENAIPGQSFMLNLDGFLGNHINATKDEMYVYLDLVSKRDFFTYLNTKRKVNYLPTWKVVEDYDIDKLKTNRLLYVDENNIYFVYEGEEDNG